MKPLLKTLLLIFVCLASTLSQAAVVSLNPNNANIHVGEQFDVAVWVHDAFAIDAADELLGFGFNTESSGTGQLQFMGSTISPLFDDVSAALNLDAAGFAFPGWDINAIGSSFSLATLRFQALTAGDVLLTVGSDLADFNQGLIFLGQGNLAIDASLNLQVSAVPIPTTAWIFMSGLIALGAVSRRPIAAC
ncbi:hypothetical protein [Methylomonas methanica]|uniref:Secreted protein n=1 Tax=Methylomonas methanica (strain DSM 25384 / MC09) TaxID=857087 RepID=G0A1K4_METMM|nr:hypothetical protein [Methylomonas methanica]AEG00065.1 hypothetical protein Metme_1646 [Methylomonas methanica MC09]